MDRLTREMTFEEEYVILQKEAKELFDKEDKESEPSESNCILRRALRCIKKLVAKLEELKDYQDKNKLVVRVDVENMDSIKDKIDELSKYAENQYNKAIDDVLKLPKYKFYDTSNEFMNIRIDAISIEDILMLKEKTKGKLKGRTDVIDEIIEYYKPCNDCCACLEDDRDYFKKKCEMDMQISYTELVEYLERLKEKTNE